LNQDQLAIEEEAGPLKRDEDVSTRKDKCFALRRLVYCGKQYKFRNKLHSRFCPQFIWR
jgi:hypothetical protein